jgi:hypothetical protein
LTESDTLDVWDVLNRISVSGLIAWIGGAAYWDVKNWKIKG